MDTDIAPTSLASGRTVPIGAECGGGVHDTPPGCAWQHGHEEYVWTPVWFTTSPHHGLVWSYRTCYPRKKTPYVAVRRPDTLCVRGVFALFLLTQRLVAFGDINYVGETTLIVTINNRGAA